MRFWGLPAAVFVGVVCISGISFAQNSTFVINDPIREDLLRMGKHGPTVAAARDHVIKILQSQNSCSAWFQEVDSNAASTFASLRFVIEASGPREVVGLRSHSGEMLLMHPYCARALENAGGNSVVFLNPNGAFFVHSAVVLTQISKAGPYRPSGWRYLLVGSYRGDTLAAQITILLHELGHVVGRLPDDSDELSGQSGRNTAEVLHYCRDQIKAASRGSLRWGP